MLLRSPFGAWLTWETRAVSRSGHLLEKRNTIDDPLDVRLRDTVNAAVSSQAHVTIDSAGHLL
jgi:hypothetical protein